MKNKVTLFIFALAFLSLSAHAQLQMITTIAGNGYDGFSGDGGLATAATLWGPVGVALDPAGNVLVVDYYNFRIRKISTSGDINTIIGTGTAGNSGNGSAASGVDISPYAVATDMRGNIFVSVTGYSDVRRINSSGIISNYAGNGSAGYWGDNGPAVDANLNKPYGLTADNKGNLYIADAGSSVVRKVDTFGYITTVAGNGSPGYSGDLGQATAAQLDSPYAVAVDSKGNLYISDYMNNVIRKVNDTGLITTFAGVNGVAPAYSGDNGAAALAVLNGPRGIATDAIGNLYIADAGNNVIRKVDTFGIITTVAGNGSFGYSGDFTYAKGTTLFNPYGVAVDAAGSLYIADANNERIRKTYAANVGVATLPAKSGIQVFPNPFTDQVSVTGLTKSDKVSVYNVVGQQVSEVWDVATAGVQSFNISSLAGGVYMLQVWDSEGNKKATVQLVKE